MVEDTNAIKERLTSLVQYATLAPSSHNTQCWKFFIDGQNASINIKPDMDRRCPVVDPDDHHLYATLGCAVENIVVASKAHGLDATVDLSKLSEEGIDVRFQPSEVQGSELFFAIPKRQCTRARYDGKPLPPEELDVLKEACQGDGVKALFLTEEADVDNVLQFILRANTRQIDNPNFVQELVQWVRFNTHEASNKGDGLSGPCVSAPMSAPRWLGEPIAIFKHLALKSRSENAKVTGVVRRRNQLEAH